MIISAKMTKTKLFLSGTLQQPIYVIDKPSTI